MVRSEGDMSLKNPVTPPGIDPGTVRLVAHCLKHYANPGPARRHKAVIMTSNMTSGGMATDFSSYILSLKARRHFHASPYVIRCGQSSTGTGFSPITPVNGRQCLSTNSRKNLSHLSQKIL
jgi:hypothetical protein